MAERAPTAAPADWLDVTKVGLCNRLHARLSLEKIADKSKASNSRKVLLRRALDYLAKLIEGRDYRPRARRHLHELESARRESVEAALAVLPDARRLAAEHPAVREIPLESPEDILACFSDAALITHAVNLDQRYAELETVALESFAEVACPALGAHLAAIELAAPATCWITDVSRNGQRVREEWRTPSGFLKAIVHGDLTGRSFESDCGDFSISKYKQAAEQRQKPGGPQAEREAEKAGLLLRVLAQKCSGSERSWTRCREIARRMLHHMAAAKDGMRTARGSDPRPVLSPDNRQRLRDEVFHRVASAQAHPPATGFLPLVRRRALAQVTDNPSSAELIDNPAGAIATIRRRLDAGKIAPQECLVFAHWTSRMCLVGGDLAEGEATPRSDLTLDLLSAAAATDESSIRATALRYLAGFATNPRFIGTSRTPDLARRAISEFEALSSGSGLSGHFRAREHYLEGRLGKAKAGYIKLFLSVLPRDGRRQERLCDSEALSYLIPECYALAPEILPDPARDQLSDEIRGMIEKISNEHFGIICFNWMAEAERIRRGFDLKRALWRDAR